VAARPGMGKSSFTVAIANHAAVAGKRVAIFSLEMTDVQIAKRFVSNNTNIHGNMLYNEGLTKVEYIDKFDQAVAELRPLPLEVIQSPGLNVQTLAYKCKQLHAAGGLDLVIIDYIQIMDVLNDKANREQQISIISRALKRLALEINVPVIVLSQLNREVDKRSNKRPFLSDLRDSGAIEQDADVVMFIYRHGYYVEQGMASPEGDNNAAEFIFSKNRNGSLFMVDVMWDGNRTRFYHPRNEPTQWPQVEGYNINQPDKAPY